MGRRDLALLGSKLKRIPVSAQDINRGIKELEDKLFYRLATKGYGAYASRHEIYGILAEEMDELLDELRINTRPGYKNYRKELKDIAVAALYGMICMDQKYIPFFPKKK